MFSLEFKGKTYVGETKAELKKNLKKNNLIFSTNLLNKMIKQEPIKTYLVNKKTKEIVKLDVSKNYKPLLKQKFNISKKDINKNFKNPYFSDINKNFKISSRIPKKSKVNIIINVQFNFKISADVRKEIRTYNYNGINNEESIDYFLNLKQNEYLSTIGSVDEVYPMDILGIIGKYTEEKMEFKDMILRDVQPLNIFNDEINVEKENNIPPENKNCVHHLLEQSKYRIKKKLKNLPEEPTIKDLETFCINERIKLKIYDINKQIVANNDNYDKKQRQSCIKAIAYNNHLYPFKNNFLDKQVKKKLNFNYVENINDKLVEFLDNGIMPKNISNAKDARLSYFIVKDNVYSNNQDYLIVKEIAEKFGISDKITYSTNLVTIGTILEKLYIKSNIMSDWFNSNDFRKGGFLYKKDIDEEELMVNMSKIKTIDKNKCYSYLLKELPYLVRVNYFDPNIIISDFKDIEDHYLYVVKPEVSSLLIPDTNVYYGYLLKYAKKQGIKFKILEGIRTEKHPNYYKEMVTDLYKNFPNHAKDIINRLIGKMNVGANGQREIYKFHKVCNKDESQRTKGFKFKLNSEYDIFYQKEKITGLTSTSKPISFQILDNSRILLYEKCRELKLNDEDIIKVKTDSISFISNDLDYGLDLDDDDFNGWKEEDFKDNMKYTGTIDNFPPSFKSVIYNDDQETILNTGNAGCGKTYLIMNELIPSLKEDYIILTPSNSTMSEYKKNNFNVAVKQKFTFNHSIPEEKNIIIDEVGMFDQTDFKMIVKCILSNKNIYAYGDFTQLLPVKSDTQLDTPFLIKSIFQKQKTLTENHRNNFTSEYYDDLRYNMTQNQRIKEVEKHNTDIKNADYVIVYTNDTRKKYNKIKMEQLGLKEITNKSCKVICKSNNLREKDIFNNFKFKVEDTNDETVIISDDNNSYCISINDFNKYFEPAYALTLYSIQGETINNFHYANEDYKFLNGRSTYTLISRLKQNKTL
jgi:hypothetical protein